MTDTFTEAGRLWPGIKKYKKLLVSVVVSTGPLVLFLLEPRSTAEVIAAGQTWLLLNFGVGGVKNES